MSNITDIDKNFVVETNIKQDGIKYYNPEEKPFSLHGVFREGDALVRVPSAVAETVNEGVKTLSRHTAGGRVRFRTNSKYIAVVANITASRMPHFAFAGSAGFDIYVDGRYFSTYVPTIDVTKHIEGIKLFPDSQMRDITIHLPLYSCVHELYIGLDETAAVEEAVPYRLEKPMVYYGSSITQGGCASRPGMAYQNIISRHFDCDQVNLGYSGSAKGEETMARYIAGLEMSVFVLDYDHNAPTVEHLDATHEKFFKIIREANPTLPIIMMERPAIFKSEDDDRRRAVIKKTYNNAKAAGDKNVYYISSQELCELCGADGLVDGAHPTDFGFASMAKAIIEVIEENGVL